MQDCCDLARLAGKRLLLGEVLRSTTTISEKDLSQALQIQTQYGGRLGSILVRTGALAEDELLRTLSSQLQLQHLQKTDLPDAQAVGEFMANLSVPLHWWLDRQVVLWSRAESEDVAVLSKDPLDPAIAEAVQASLIPNASYALCASHELDRLIEAIRAASCDTQDDSVITMKELAEGAPVVELVSSILSRAADEDASDVHVVPDKEVFYVRYRIDGVLHQRMSLPRARFDAVCTRIKLLSELDIAERRLPQDGRFTLRTSGKEFDIRTSALPGTCGESLVMRFLPKNKRVLQLGDLGFEPDTLNEISKQFLTPNGIILVTGPTGSGKSTTLYSAIDLINCGTKNIVTVEDPVEYEIAGVQQVQAHSEIGYDFARALRAILRQDPDVILIGEIRDAETAQIAVQAALTGHLVLSSLHTNDAKTAFSRLQNLGVSPFLIANSVRCVLAQRLVRRLCAECSELTEVSPEISRRYQLIRTRLADKGAGLPNWRRARGCHHCRGTGYRGRLGIYELLSLTPEMQAALERGNDIADLGSPSSNFLSLFDDGLLKAGRGESSLEEIYRVANAEMAYA